MNSINLTGNLVKPPELETLPSGTYKTTFRIAVNGRRRTAYVTLVCFGAQAKAVADHLTTGSKVGVEAHYQTDEWKDKESGENRSYTYQVADNVEFLSPPPENSTEESTENGADISSGNGETEPTTEEAVGDL